MKHKARFWTGVVMLAAPVVGFIVWGLAVGNILAQAFLLTAGILAYLVTALWLASHVNPNEPL